MAAFVTSALDQWRTASRVRRRGAWLEELSFCGVFEPGAELPVTLPGCGSISPSATFSLRPNSIRQHMPLNRSKRQVFLIRPQSDIRAQTLTSCNSLYRKLRKTNPPKTTKVSVILRRLGKGYFEVLRSLNRCNFPVAVLGRSATNSTERRRLN